MSKKSHWSRKPEQVKRDAEFLRKAGIVFEKTPSGFSRMRPAELKEKLMVRLMEAKLDGANDPEHKWAQRIWDENIDLLKGSRKHTAVWDGLWNQKHVNRMGNSIFLFGFLLSKANGKGQVQITYKVISEEMGVPVRTLGFWMQTLKKKPSPKKKPYITIEKSSSMLIQISNFRSTKKANFGEAVMQDVAEPLCKTLPNLNL